MACNLLLLIPTVIKTPCIGLGVEGQETLTQLRIAMLGTILLVILILMVVGAAPTWPHSRNWGYYPSGGIGLILLILLILVLIGQVPIGL